MVHLQALPVCVHLNDGWMSALVYSTLVSPFARTKHFGASPALKTVAGAAVTEPTRAAMAKERISGVAGGMGSGGGAVWVRRREVARGGAARRRARRWRRGAARGGAVGLTYYTAVLTKAEQRNKWCVLDEEFQ